MQRVYILDLGTVLRALGACFRGNPEPNTAACAAVSSGVGDDFKAAVSNSTNDTALVAWCIVSGSNHSQPAPAVHPAPVHGVALLQPIPAP
jgi:hypothetical protein